MGAHAPNFQLYIGHGKRIVESFNPQALPKTHGTGYFAHQNWPLRSLAQFLWHSEVQSLTNQRTKFFHVFSLLIEDSVEVFSCCLNDCHLVA